MTFCLSLAATAWSLTRHWRRRSTPSSTRLVISCCPRPSTRLTTVRQPVTGVKYPGHRSKKTICSFPSLTREVITSYSSQTMTSRLSSRWSSLLPHWWSHPNCLCTAVQAAVEVWSRFPKSRKLQMIKMTISCQTSRSMCPNCRCWARSSGR